MDDPDSWFDEVKDFEFLPMIQTLSLKLYSFLEHKRSKQDKISGPTALTAKRVLDHIVMQAIDVFKKIVQMETKIEAYGDYNKRLEDIAGRISRQSVSSADELQRPIVTESKSKRDDHAIIITMNKEDEDVDLIKSEIKTLCRSDVSIPIPGDVIVTKNKQVILKMGNRRDTEKMREKVIQAESIKDKIKISVPQRKRERVLILSVDSAVDEEMVKGSVQKLLDDSVSNENMTREISRKLRDPDLDGAAKEALETLYDEIRPDFTIVKRIKTRTERSNWLLDVDANSKQWLLDRKKICIDFERYRVVEFVSITRCFRCQEFGHYASGCKGTQHCVKCAGEHDIKDCKETQVKCYNCYFESASGACDHRADSPDCQVYQQVRLKAIPKRS